MRPSSHPHADVRRLRTARDAAPFAPLAHVSVRLGLSRLAPDAPLVAVGAEAGGAAVGLAVAGVLHDEAHVLWLYVHPEHRRRGLARRLLARTEIEAAGAGRLVGRWLDGRPAAPAVERLLAEAGWSAPAHRLTIYRAHDDDAACVGRLPWIVAPARRPGYDVFPWGTLGAAERAQVEAGLTEGELALQPHFNPFEAGRFPVDTETSVGIRHGGRVVGWMMTRTMAPAVTLMDRLWLEPEHRWAAGAAAALAASLAVVYERDRHTPGWGCVWCTMADNRAMMAFNARRLAPYATSAVRQLESTKGPGRG